MSRSVKINRHSYDFAKSERVNWLDRFADSIEQASQLTAVEVARYRNQLSIHEQINSIISRVPSSSYATVEDAVVDMQKRTGLSEYLNRISSEKTNKVASSDVFPNLDAELKDAIISFCKNKIATHRGQITVPAMQHEILETFSIQPDDVNNEPVARFISDLILKEQKANPAHNDFNTQLGLGVGRDDVESSDPENTDFFKGMLPSD